MLVKFLAMFLAFWATDVYLFPLAIYQFPLNFKLVGAICGAIALGYDLIRGQEHAVSKHFFGALCIATLYSVVNLIAVEVNDEFDFSYATYVASFLTWTFGAYSVIRAIRLAHGKVSLRLVCGYLTVVATFQCILAVLNDNVVAIDNFTNSLINTEFYKEINRMYGLGAALDPAGTRFSFVLVFIAFIMCIDERVKHSNWALLGFMSAFFIISMFGNMVSRTTSVGMLLGLLVIAFSTGIYRLQILVSNIKMYTIFGFVMLVVIPFGIYLYVTDPYFESQFRFAFEGFFGLIEQGEWTSQSNDILMNSWVWPETTKEWIIGTGLFDNFVHATDIGYCRLILYSGLIGFTVFSMLFVYSAIAFIGKYRRYRYMFIMMLALSFIIWVKVSTDLYQFWALLYVFVDREEANYKPKLSFL